MKAALGDNVKSSHLFGYTLPLGALLLVVFASSTLGGSADRSARQQPISVLKESESSAGSGLKTLTNKTYGFRLTLPKNSWIDGHRDRGESEYIRIQNYRSTEERNALSPNEFWLEIHIFDHKKRRKVWEPCSTWLVESTASDQDGVKVHFGKPREPSVDAGGYMRALCAETTGFDIYISASENNNATPLLKKILGSFEFVR